MPWWALGTRAKGMNIVIPPTEKQKFEAQRNDALGLEHGTRLYQCPSTSRRYNVGRSSGDEDKLLTVVNGWCIQTGYRKNRRLGIDSDSV